MPTSDPCSFTTSNGMQDDTETEGLLVLLLLGTRDVDRIPRETNPIDESNNLSQNFIKTTSSQINFSQTQ